MKKIITIKLFLSVLIILIFALSSFLHAFAAGQRYEYIEYLKSNPSVLESLEGGQRFAMFAPMNFAAYGGYILFMAGLFIFILSFKWIKNRIFIILSSVMGFNAFILMIINIILTYIIKVN